MKTRTIIFLTLLVLYSLIYTWMYYQLDIEERRPFQIKTGVECGTVIANYSETHSVKHGYRDEMYLKVQYPDRVEIINVDGATWFDSPAGKRVCFATYRGLPFVYFPALLVSHIGGLLLGVLILISIIAWCLGFEFEL